MNNFKIDEKQILQRILRGLQWENKPPKTLHFLVNSMLRRRASEILCQSSLEVSTVVQPSGWSEWLIRNFIDNHCHSLNLMYFNEAVKELSARIIRYEIDDHVLQSESRDHNHVINITMVGYISLDRIPHYYS